MINYIIEGKEYTSVRPIKEVGINKNYENGTIIFRNEKTNETKAIGIIQLIDKTKENYKDALTYLTDEEIEKIEKETRKLVYIRFFFKSRTLFFEDYNFIKNITYNKKTIFCHCFVDGKVFCYKKVYKNIVFVKNNIYILCFNENNDYIINKVGTFNYFTYKKPGQVDNIKQYIDNNPNRAVLCDYYNNKTLIKYYENGKIERYEILKH